ncbi:hypothetical protein BKA58DRAFT_391893 [Alternaria rosae]|uniref:uncharacterized protein n=1 Tax=Alternaria rosae TaxID=1187941 RepID=UPI001E8DE6D7|nr:uncharacterized protein BKA58DRAFT_391893 [Alternaria rosae]KAH6860643.1 hypothetical protein BKA58DRAFT_391893 [Alternaria rosae]
MFHRLLWRCILWVASSADFPARALVAAMQHRSSHRMSRRKVQPDCLARSLFGDNGEVSSRYLDTCWRPPSATQAEGQVLPAMHLVQVGHTQL